MKSHLTVLMLIGISAISSAEGSELDAKAYSYCEKQYDFMYFTAIAATGKNVKMSEQYPEMTEYRVLGRNLMFSDDEINRIVLAYKDDYRERHRVIATYNSVERRDISISCSQIPAQVLATYDRLKKAGYLN